MLTQHWDDELANMAKIWVMKCEKYKKDPCTQLKRDGNITFKYIFSFSKITFFFVDKLLYSLVNQNLVYWPSDFQRPGFYANMINFWYSQKSDTPAPEIIDNLAYFSV